MPIPGGLVAAVFGTVFVMVNANEPLNPTFGPIVRALAGLAPVSFLIKAVVTPRRGRVAPARPRLLDAPPRTGVA
ncbi:hypothetical protein ACPZ19_07215 [Amycolatopsis lurida]